MYLTKIELNGFKSFADKTSLKILPGITSIVGPNGCGKTNIVDAISWVLGEQRIRLLRGYKMEDVIFNGTSGRQPVGMAEVTLTFDNSDGTLPVEYREVGISRRVYRSGESEYFINKNPCRLRDISDLLLGTGLGTRAYSLVGQGRIDQILQARPEERRQLLEEAAQISRYRQKKEESLRKLEQTQNNLLRIEDILKEVRRQLSIADRQARQAERYRAYRDRLRELETEAGLRQLSGFRRRSRELGAEKEHWLAKYRALEKEVEEIETGLTRLRAGRGEKQEALASTRADLIGNRAEIDKRRHRIEVNAERGGELKHERGRLDEEIRKIGDSLAAARKETGDHERSREGLIEANQAAAEALRGKEKELELLRRERAAAEKALASLQSQSLELSRRESHLRNELLGLQAGGKELALRKRKLEVELERVGEEEGDLKKELAEAEPLTGTAESALASIRERLAGERTASAKAEEEARALRVRRESLLVAAGELESRKRALQERGQDGSADLLLAAVRERKADLPGVLGRLDDFITIEPGGERMVRAALGEKARAVVAVTGSDALRAIEYLRGKKTGPIRFIVLAWLQRAAAVRPSGPGGRNGAGLSRRMTLAPPLEGLEEALLEGEVPVVELAGSAGEGFTPSPGPVVTVEGAAILPPGVIFWVGEAEPAEAFGLPELEAELKRLRAAKEEAAAAEKEMEKRLADLRARVEETVCDLHRQEMEVALDNNEQARRRRGLQKLILSGEAIKNEIESLAEEQRRATGRLEQLELELKECPSRDQIEEARLASLRVALDERNLALRGLESAVTEMKISLASAREREDSLTGRLERLFAENRNLQELLEARRRQIADDQSRERSLREETEQLRKDIGELELQVDELKSRVSLEEEEIGRLNRECGEKEEVYQKIRPRFQEVQSNLGSQDVTLAELRVKEQAVCQRIREKYHIELDELELPPGEADLDALAGEIEQIREKMDRMTSVNLAALEDKENYEDRLKLLTEQKSDLEAAIRDIDEAITRINVTAREKLQAAYDTVRQHFQSLFSHLFGGGLADLVLDNEKDILESGLDIIAQPPGKKLSHISLLSGGERALTTIALIFALFKVQPSPFYILDEIDAPLDEANIGRFVNLLKELVAESQFIIITHNKRSISEADILYGITMEESGVSKVVSVRLGAGAKAEEPVEAS
ncbi:MAG: chromosome segregation protein SMC [PVC group bacterium]